MPAPLARRDFFSLEAGEYLERLSLLTAAEPPFDVEAMVRCARALRGAALMAGPPAYAALAAAIESLVKSMRDQPALWSPEVAEALADALLRGKALLRRLDEWGEAEVALCERTAGRLDDAAGGQRTGSGPFAAPTESAGVRAYISRETAALASLLNRAATGRAPETVPSVLQGLQPLRGLGALPGLSPLPELLEALEVTLGQAEGNGLSAALPPALHAASVALARIAREIAELGAPLPEAPESAAAAQALREACAEPEPVTSIVALFRADDPDPIISRGTPPEVKTATSLRAELVGLADRLRQLATHLLSMPRSPARALQVHSMALALRAMSPGPALGKATGELLAQIDGAVMRGRALSEPAPVAASLRGAASILSEAGEQATLSGLSAELSRVVKELALLEGPADIVPIESLAPDREDDIVPIESLLATADGQTNGGTNYTSFEQSFSTYYRLLHSTPPARAVPEPDPVPIDTLLLRGRRALERADRVRQELGEALRTQDSADIQVLLNELLDLVPLALQLER